jgi:hypothetical protein
LYDRLVNPLGLTVNCTAGGLSVTDVVASVVGLAALFAVIVTVCGIATVVGAV